MKYSASEFNKMIGAKLETTDEIINFDILNFIRVIHLNKQNFIELNHLLIRTILAIEE